MIGGLPASGLHAAGGSLNAAFGFTGPVVWEISNPTLVTPALAYPLGTGIFAISDWETGDYTNGAADRVWHYEVSITGTGAGNIRVKKIFTTHPDSALMALPPLEYRNPCAGKYGALTTSNAYTIQHLSDDDLFPYTPWLGEDYPCTIPMRPSYLTNNLYTTDYNTATLQTDCTIPAAGSPTTLSVVHPTSGATVTVTRLHADPPMSAGSLVTTATGSGAFRIPNATSIARSGEVSYISAGPFAENEWSTSNTRLGVEVRCTDDLVKLYLSTTMSYRLTGLTSDSRAWEQSYGDFSTGFLSVNETPAWASTLGQSANLTSTRSIAHRYYWTDPANPGSSNPSHYLFHTVNHSVSVPLTVTLLSLGY